MKGHGTVDLRAMACYTPPFPHPFGIPSDAVIAAISCADAVNPEHLLQSIQPTDFMYNLPTLRSPPLRNNYYPQHLHLEKDG